MASQSTPYISVEEYLEREENAIDRHEYLHGEVFAMAGATEAHSDIAVNITTTLHIRLRGRGCKVRGSDQRIRTHPSGLYSYADVVVICGAREIEKNSLLNPILIVEVLSQSTENYDRGKKFEEYRRIRSFREYLIVAQDRPYVEHHARTQDRIWTMQEHTSLADVVKFEALEIDLPMTDIYSDISFANTTGS